MRKEYSLSFPVGELGGQLILIEPVWKHPSKPYYPHRHPTFELYYITDGQCRIKADNAFFDLRPGQLLLLPPDTFHRAVSVSEDTRIMTLSFSVSPPAGAGADSHSARMLAAFRAARPALFRVTATELGRILARIRVLAYEDEHAYFIREKLRSLCSLLLLELFDLLASKEAERPAPAPSAAVPPDFLIDEFFSQHFNRNDASELLAKKLNVSPRQLNRIIKRSCGKNYREKLNETRLQVARDLLTTTDKSVTQIAQVLGYSSPANFSSFIRSATGMSPTQLRQAGRTSH